VPLEPRHPLEPALHEQLRSAFNQGLRNKNFFVWIDVRPTGAAEEFADLAPIVQETERWLATQDPDETANPNRLPELHFTDPAAEVTVQAIPRKHEARARPAEEIVGNPAPILVGYE
jgi:hypothetical protein